MNESDPDYNNNREKALSIKHQLEQVIQYFWKTWRKDYLLELRSTHVGNKTKESDIKVNEIVTALDENQNRNKWRFEKIEKLIAGKKRNNKRSRGKGYRAKSETHSYNETPPEALSSRNK